MMQKSSSKQYWVFMLNALCDAVFCSIDTAFGNHISTDVIAALGSFWTLHWVLTQCTGVGIYTYQIQRKHPYNCIVLDILIGVVLGVLLIMFRVPVSHIFKLTEVQYEMLQQCLLLDGITLPMEAAARFMMSYITYSCYNRLLVASNVLTYILLIGTDWLVVELGLGCIGLTASTAITWGVYLIVVVIGCKFWRVRDKLHIRRILQCAAKSRHLLIYRIVSRIAYAIHGGLMSTLGAPYVIHTICLDIMSISEEFRNGMYNYQLVELKPAKDKVATCAKTNKRFYLPSLLIEVSFCLIAVIFMHGKVPLMEVLPFLLIYMSYMPMMPLYDSLNAYLVVTDQTHVVAVKSVFACVYKIFVTMLFLRLGFGLYGAAIVIFLETATAIIYYMRKCNWLRYKKESDNNG